LAYLPDRLVFEWAILEPPAEGPIVDPSDGKSADRKLTTFSKPVPPEQIRRMLKSVAAEQNRIEYDAV
jgi:hypothetical protein